MAVETLARLRIALLIGQQGYAESSGFSQLPGAHNDVDSMRLALQSLCGFHVTAFKDAKRSDFDTLRRLLVQDLRGCEGAVVVLFYAGHALSIHGQAFLVPVDAQCGAPESYVNLNELLRSLHDITGIRSRAVAQRAAIEAAAIPAPGALALVVLDACRERESASCSDGLLQELTRGGQLRPRDSQLCMLFACDEGTVARDDQDAGHGFLTEAFLHCLQACPGARLYELLEAVVARCQDRTNGRQRPWFHSCSREASSLVLWQPTDDMERITSEAAICLDCEETQLDGSEDMRNDEGAQVRKSPQSAIFYCGRFLGKKVILGSDGRCGPTDGPQCPSCKHFQVISSKSTDLQALVSMGFHENAAAAALATCACIEDAIDTLAHRSSSVEGRVGEIGNGLRNAAEGDAAYPTCLNCTSTMVWVDMGDFQCDICFQDDSGERWRCLHCMNRTWTRLDGRSGKGFDICSKCHAFPSMNNRSASAASWVAGLGKGLLVGAVAAATGDASSLGADTVANTSTTAVIESLLASAATENRSQPTDAQVEEAVSSQVDECLFPIWRVHGWSREARIRIKNVARADTIAIMKALGGEDMDVVGHEVGIVAAKKQGSELAPPSDGEAAAIYRITEWEHDGNGQHTAEGVLAQPVRLTQIVHLEPFPLAFCKADARAQLADPRCSIM